ncbi:RHTO0S13e02542g1_1 [Rhodotorula toruloides]|uniref:RHTO0S13e02542g1_1 n=2 Tax=Rhodotorula toruloides TaxID=5286 RepID=A0A061BIN8_RHOTO|nr:cytochrome c oxidase, subunit VIIa [Rhodotorula toruloides NP11]EMS22477.1 cytochrome c oxidase, subunit VIIa [Rhodotorula toruloides NP11]CDR46851.1 RHTO0S13e02542g1_1 [Rhodotorula toruloides]
MLRRSAIKHVTLGISSGLAGGYIFWYGWHIPQVRRRDEWYLEQERRKQAGEA